MVKVGDVISFYDVASRKKVKAKVKKIVKKKGRKRATGSLRGMKLSKFIK